MKKSFVFLFAALAGTNLMAATLHVDLNSVNPKAPYASRDTAATNIQTAVNAAVAGDTVQVWDGHYLLSSEISVTKAISIKSVNGPESTIVDGQGTVRCFNLGNSACVLDGLTITNGFTTGYGGGIYCSRTTPVVTNCTLSGNTAFSGGGMYYGTANHCTLSGNSAEWGGGMYYGTANHCTLSGNTASSDGGGMYYGTANHSALSGNTAKNGGGMYYGTVNHCTLSGNTASRYGGGMYSGTANNCIVWYNTAPLGKDLNSSTAKYSCSPEVTPGVDGNITNAPMLLSSSHIAADSPCRGAGSAKYTTGTDIDGEAWTNPPSMGCDEPADFPGGPLKADFVSDTLVVATDYTVRFREQIDGALSMNIWDFGDGTRMTNSIMPMHAWAIPGNYDVALTAFNADLPDGVSVTQRVVIVDGVTTAIHVSPDGNDANDGLSWETAKATIQAGVDSQIYSGGRVLVGSGSYGLTNEIVVDKRVRIIGVNGPDSTKVNGQGQVRCFNLNDSACIIEGLMITNGYAGNYDGGGIYCSDTTPIVTNCIISGNSAKNGGGMVGGTANHCTLSGNTATEYGGGMYFGTANHCAVSGNTAYLDGGGMCRGTANNCTITWNSASKGGGMDWCTANHCTLSGNTASSDGGGMYYGTANHCTLSGNTANRGGGMANGTANNCTLSGNTASSDGGGMAGGTANNCTISDNWASYSAGGMYWGTANHCALNGNSAKNGGGMANGTANNCTLIGNSATQRGGGMDGGMANNCIVYHNIAPDANDISDATTHYSCSPDVTPGVDGNITNAPMLLSSSHIAADSPCRGAGRAVYATGTDIDREPWANPPSMGCDEPAGFPGGPLKADFVSDTLVAASDYTVRFREQIDGALSMNIWDFGDGTRMTNSIMPMHAWAIPGNYDVVLTALNADLPDGVSVTQRVVIVDGVTTAIHVSPDGNDANDGLSWETAKATIQAGVDSQIYSGGRVLIGSGSYSLTNEIVVDKPVRIIGAYGPDSTKVNGQGQVRCFNLGDSFCVVEGLTITNGYSSGSGGGIYCSGITPMATNCILSGNSARYGGGMVGGTANHCTFIGNTASSGGGMYYGIANHSTLSGNTASSSSGGGMCYGTANHCTLSGNTASSYGGGMYDGTANHCTLSGNSANGGGGMYSGTANYCTFSGNTASSYGGGMVYGTANHCILSGNSAEYGGGMANGTANNCTLSGNSATENGGGMYYGTANNCTLSGNSARYGGGRFSGTANNCTISGNSATHCGGGIYYGTANNCIVYHNIAPGGNDISDAITHYSCSPDVTPGVDGNITNTPVLVSSSHIAVDSPCRGAGSAGYAIGTDIDGEAWANPPSMGCDEPADFAGGPLKADFVSDTFFSVSDYTVRFREQIDGALSMNIWDFGDGTRMTNSIVPVHAWAISGNYDVVLTAFNADLPDGVSATQTVVIVDRETTAIHVSTDGDDANDGLSWETAKATIQAGVDSQIYSGGRVLVGSGSYSLTNEIVVDKPVRIIGVDGPDSTTVDGQGQVRCFNLGGSACVVEGLTITNGYSSGNGGGIYCSETTPVVTNCILSGNAASSGGGMAYGTANNCTLSGNSATENGGGMYYGTANNCTLRGNSARYGGGMYYGTANNCTLRGNSAESGGGMSGGTANHCTISGNTVSSDGGGMSGGTANHCTISGNTASSYGGGMNYSSANNCTISGNTANYGGGMIGGTANNCILSGNSAFKSGGGMSGGTANNCIIWYNTAPSGKDLKNSTTARYCCSPDVTPGVDGNITNAPMLVSSSHIAADSPCRGAGRAVYATGTDIDREPWANPPSMGCDEPAGFPGGPLKADFVSETLVAATDYTVRFREQIHGALSMNIWDFGDGTRMTNSIMPMHAWAIPGNYDVVLTAFNADQSDGVSATQTVEIVDGETTAIHVSTDGDDANDGTSWASAKATIQAGVDAQGLPGGWVLVGSGSYSLSATIMVHKPIRIIGADGHDSTKVDGQGQVCCFNLGGSSCVVEGLTITNGYSSGSGGGIYCSDTTPVVTNCILSGNSAFQYGGGMYQGTANNCTISGNSASQYGGGMYQGTANNCTISGNSASQYGGGMYQGTANNCTISGNSASQYGGGMYQGTANNCTISGNSASYGGGMYSGTANNCIVYGNTAPQGSDVYYATVYYSCSPDAAHGVNGNITNAPAFVDAANGDYRLGAGSPCIDAGSYAYVVGSLDLAGLPRIVGGLVDMGAYEFQMASSTDADSDRMNDSWEQEYFGGLDRDGAGDYDGDGLLDLAEYISGTDPTDASSSFTAKVGRPDSGGFVVEWTSVEGRTYSVFWNPSLDTDFELLQDGIEYPQNSYTDTVHSAESAGFYQIGVRLK